jgi:hypothetical protein
VHLLHEAALSNNGQPKIEGESAWIVSVVFKVMDDGGSPLRAYNLLWQVQAFRSTTSEVTPLSVGDEVGLDVLERTQATELLLFGA